MADSDARLRITAENRTKQAFDEIRRHMGGVEGAASSLRGTLAGLGVGLSAAGLVGFIRSGINAADELNKLSQKVGVSVESLSALQYAAKLSDVSMEELSTGLRQLAKNATDTAAGTGDAKDAFKALGIEVTNASGQLKSSEELLLSVAEQFAGIEDGAGKTAIAMRLFGRAGAQLIPLLNSGRAGFEALRAEAERLGVILSSETARAAEQFNDDLTRLAASADRLKFQLADALLPSLTRFVAEIVEGNRIAGSFTESLRVFSTINPFRSLAGNVKVLNEELHTLEKRAEAFKRFDGAVPERVEKAIADTKKRLEFVKFQQRQEALALLPPGFQDDAARLARQSPAAPVRRAAPLLPGTGAGKGDGDKSFDNAIRQLQEEALKVQELTRFEEVLAGIESGRYGKLDEAQKLRLQQLAAAVDLAREDARVQKEVAEVTSRASEESARLAKAEADRIEAAARGYKDLIDPIQQYRVKLVEIRDLVKKGLLTPEQGLEAEFAIQNKIEELNQLKGEIKDASDIGRELGLTFTSTFEDIVAGSGKAGDALRALAQDVAKLLFRKTVTEPLLGNISGALKGFDLSSIFGSLFGGARAEGGPVSAGRAYLVGERGPELFVPSASGAIAPNAGRGNTYYIDARGADAGAIARLEQRLLALNASVEQRVLAGVFDARTRGLLPG